MRSVSSHASCTWAGGSMLLTYTLSRTLVSPGCPSSPTTWRNVRGLSTSPWTRLRRGPRRRVSAREPSQSDDDVRGDGAERVLERRYLRVLLVELQRHTDVEAVPPHDAVATPGRRSERADSRCGSLPWHAACTNRERSCARPSRAPIACATATIAVAAHVRDLASGSSMLWVAHADRGGLSLPGDAPASPPRPPS